MTRKLDINRVLSAADTRQFEFYKNLSNDERKEFVYSVVMRFANTISGSVVEQEDYLIRLNERVNQYGDLMWKHPDLAYAMMASCGRGYRHRHQYTKGTNRKVEDRTIREFLSIHNPGLNDEECDLVLMKMDKDSFTQLVRESGLTPDEEKKIIAAYAKKYKKPR